MSGMAAGRRPAPGSPEDTFLEILAAHGLNEGRRLTRRLAEEIALLGPTRRPWRPLRQPLAAQYPATLARGPRETADLRGALTGFRDSLTWRRASNAAAGGDAVCTLVGGDRTRIPSDRIRLGLMLLERDRFRPLTAESANSIYLPLSGRLVLSAAGLTPYRPYPGRMIVVPGGQDHAIWTGGGTALLVWARLGPQGAA